MITQDDSSVLPRDTAIYDTLLEVTWPAARLIRQSGWLLREGLGGGKRVSAATPLADWQDETIPVAEAVMADLGQRALFRIGEDDVMLDQALQSRGYRIVDPVLVYEARTEELAHRISPDHHALPHWPCLRICEDIWAAGGIDSARLAVMERVQTAKAALLARNANHAIGAGFVALHAQRAMLHAVEVREDHRRQGGGRAILQSAAEWALMQGASHLSLVVTLRNTAARALYSSMGMEVVAKYHYRQR